MAHINKCIEDLLRKSMTVLQNFYFRLSEILLKCLGGKKPVEKHAAVWVPDNEANVCMHCKKTQFTMIVRRVSELKSFRCFSIASINHSISASLSKLRCCCMWSVFIKEIFTASTKFKTSSRLFRLLRFIESNQNGTGKMLIDILYTNHS